MVVESDRQWIKERDAKENRESTPPAGEHVDLLSVWVAECFPPSETDHLINCIRQLGWGESKWRNHLGSESLDAWIENRRWSANGWATFPINLIVREEDRAKWLGGDIFTADLSAIATHATASLHHVFSGLFVLAIQFFLSTSPSERLNEVLRKEFHTRVDRFDGGRVHVGVISQKREAADSIRQHARRECVRWVKGTLPGVFARTGGLSAYPTCDFITVNLVRPADPEQRQGWGSYLNILDIDRDLDAWSSDDFPGLRLILPDSQSEDRFALTLTAKRAEALSDRDLQGSGGRTRDGLTFHLRTFDGSMVAWSLHALLTVYERQYASMREMMTRVVEPERMNDASQRLKTLETSLLRLSSDAVTVSDEMKRYCEEKNWFLFHVGTFYPVNPFWSVPKQHSPEDELLVDKLGRPIPLRTKKRVKPTDLFDDLRQSMLRRAIWTRQTEELVRQFIQAQSAMVNARAQERLATSNIRLQRALLWLTVVLLVMGMLQLLATLRN